MSIIKVPHPPHPVTPPLYSPWICLTFPTGGRDEIERGGECAGKFFWRWGVVMGKGGKKGRLPGLRPGLWAPLGAVGTSGWRILSHS